MIIELPFKTPTINHLYWHRGNMKIMTKDAKELRNEIIEIVDNLTIDFNTEKKLKVKIEIFEDWMNLDGSIKRKDIQNREKFLIDSVFKALDVDDKMIFDCRFIKIQSKDIEKALITIETV